MVNSDGLKEMEDDVLRENTGSGGIRPPVKEKHFPIPHFAPLLLVDQFPVQWPSDSAIIIEASPIELDLLTDVSPTYAIASDNNDDQAA
jgi:hypothetical protein